MIGPAHVHTTVYQSIGYGGCRSSSICVKFWLFCVLRTQQIRGVEEKGRATYLHCLARVPPPFLIETPLEIPVPNLSVRKTKLVFLLRAQHVRISPAHATEKGRAYLATRPLPPPPPP